MTSAPSRDKLYTRPSQHDDEALSLFEIFDFQLRASQSTSLHARSDDLAPPPIREINFDAEMRNIHDGESLGEDVSNEDVFTLMGRQFATNLIKLGLAHDNAASRLGAD